MAISREEDMYARNEENCSYCPFHQVCLKNTEGGMMAELEAKYMVRPWDNTRVGVDI
jgi:uncharacterized protein (UPF0179 family)